MTLEEAIKEIEKRLDYWRKDVDDEWNKPIDRARIQSRVETLEWVLSLLKQEGNSTNVYK